MDVRSWYAMGTNVRLLVEDGDPVAARRAVEKTLSEVDLAYSRFRPDSEIRRLVATRGAAVEVSPLLMTALEAAIRAARLTDGAVDPTVGRAMRLIGYDDDFARTLAERGEIVLRQEPIPGWRSVRLDRSRRHVSVAAGVELDLGSTGKALAADLAAESALGSGAAGALVSLGGDIAVAGRPPSGGWHVLVTEDSATPPDADGEVIAIRDGAVATSSTTVRRWRRGSTELHHLVDPRTGLPADSPWRTVTVLAATCVDANAAATATIVMGQDGLDWLRSTGLPARLISTSGTTVRVGRWPTPARMSTEATTAEAAASPDRKVSIATL